MCSECVFFFLPSTQYQHNQIEKYIRNVGSMEEEKNQQISILTDLGRILYFKKHFDFVTYTHNKK